MKLLKQNKKQKKPRSVSQINSLTRWDIPYAYLLFHIQKLEDEAKKKEAEERAAEEAKVCVTRMVNFVLP